MNLMEIYRLIEVGDRVKSPPGATYHLNKNGSIFLFRLDDLSYKVNIDVTDHYESVALNVYFKSFEAEYDLTNKHQALKLMSYIVGGIAECMKKYKEEFTPEKDVLKIDTIYYTPKSEDDETGSSEVINKRDSLYRAFVKKFANSYNSDVTFDVSRDLVTAYFEPYLEIK